MSPADDFISLSERIAASAEGRPRAPGTPGCPRRRAGLSLSCSKTASVATNPVYWGEGTESLKLAA